MKRLNLLFILSSVTVLLVTIERFSFTTNVLLQPYNFLRLHEIVQIFIILPTVLIPAFLFKELSRNFEILKKTKGQLMGLLFIVGVYFYATGNGLHEVAGFFMYEYCDPNNLVSTMCNGLFINNFYTGNIFYFVGAMMMNLALLVLEFSYPLEKWNRNDLLILAANSLVYSIAIIAYTAIDPVLVGLVSAVITTIVVDAILLYGWRKKMSLPFTLYSLHSRNSSCICGTIRPSQ
jgi:hypothetical protein